MSIEKLVNQIYEQYLSVTAIQCEIDIFEKGITHIPSMLEKGKQGVYVFYKDDICFKVGKAGPKSKARWNSHHYNLDSTTPSTMTKSIMKDLESFKVLYDNLHCDEIEGFAPDNIKSWVRNNMCRVEFKISGAESKFSLGLLESLVQFYFRPIYERNPNFSNRIKFK